jgi:hypothetical protein
LNFNNCPVRFKLRIILMSRLQAPRNSLGSTGVFDENRRT